jgi:5-methylcytosine-specific restriction endonuclease McrA
MPKKNIIIFLEKTYKTQGEFETFVKNIIYNDIGICNDIKNKNPHHYNILIEILKRHPDFFSKTQNMYNIKIIEDTLNKKAFKIIIINKDSSEIDISWKVAITGKSKGYKHDLMSAMRSSISEQILIFRRYNEAKCVLCPNTENLQVDHIIHFDEIALNFINIMERKNIPKPNIFGDTNDNTHRKCFLKIDENFKNEWVDYHYKNASLRILCQNCNLTRTKTTHKFKGV